MSNNSKKTRIEIAVHLLVWAVLFFLPVALTINTNTGWQDIALHFWLQLAFIAIIFYTNYFWLVEKKLFTPGGKFFFSGGNVLLIVLLLCIKSKLFSIFFTGPPRHAGGPPQALIWYMDFFVYLIPIAFAIAIRSGKRLINLELYQTEVENMKLQSDLQYLKFQLQPHFFFNALNNIYSLIDTDPEVARQSVHDLSKLMRHLLIASDAPTITLNEEIQFLRKYIALMRQRLSKDVEVVVDFPEQIPVIRIAPLLFISLVENAFKHGVSARQKSHLHFRMEAAGGLITFTAANSLFPKQGEDLAGSGIGLVNLQKRLSLLYPGKHQLTTGVKGDEFSAYLQIEVP